MKKKLLVLSGLILLSASIDARGGYHGGGHGGGHGGYHGGGHYGGGRYGGGWGGGAIAATALGTAAIVGTTAAIASSNRANQDPYAKNDRYQAEQDLKDQKADAKQKERNRKEDAQRQRDEDRQSRKRKRSNSDDNDNRSTKRSRTSDEPVAEQQRIQELETELAELRGNADLEA